MRGDRKAEELEIRNGAKVRGEPDETHNAVPAGG
jgi:hypothetical protein